MPIPSFEELLQEARRQSAEPIPKQFSTDELAARGVSDFVTKLLTAETPKSRFTSALTPGGEIKPIDVTTGGTVIERLLRRGEQALPTGLPAGSVPLTQEQSSQFAMTSALQKLKVSKKPLSTQSAYESGYAGIDFLRELYPDLTDEALQVKSVGEVQQRMGLKRAETVAGMRPQIKAEIDLQSYSTQALQSFIALDKLKEGARRLGDFKRGLINQLIAKGMTKVEELSADPTVSQYLGVVSQELIPAARNIMEEKGPITEFDVARVEKGLGNITLPLEDKLFLLNELENKLREAVKQKAGIAGLSESEFRQKYGRLSQFTFGQEGKKRLFQERKPDTMKKETADDILREFNVTE